GTAGCSSAEKSAARTADFAASSATGTGHTTGSTAGATRGTDDGVWMPSKSEESTPLAACGGDSDTPSSCADVAAAGTAASARTRGRSAKPGGGPDSGAAGAPGA